MSYIKDKKPFSGLDNLAKSEPLIREVQSRTNGNYIFGGPQGSEADNRAPEFITSPNLVSDLQYKPSAHKADHSNKLERYHQTELNKSNIVPDYKINPSNENFKPQRDFQSENIDNIGIQKKLSDDEMRLEKKNKLLAEKLENKGVNYSKIQNKVPDTPTTGKSCPKKADLASQIRSAHSQSGRNSATNGSMKQEDKDKEDENDENEKPKKCKDHSQNITCMKCICGNSGAKIKQISDSGRIYGFK